MSDMKPCPVEGCQELRPGNHLVCRAHWDKLPTDLRVDVLCAWSDYRTAKTRIERQDAALRHLGVARRAIAWLSNLGNRDAGAGG